MVVQREKSLWRGVKVKSKENEVEKKTMRKKESWRKVRGKNKMTDEKA